MSRGGPTKGGVPGNGVEVLVVDDNPTNMFVLTAMLRSLGLSTLSTADGIEAVQIATEKLPALIFMDLQMPRMDGVTATRRIREAMSEPRPAIVAVTAYADVSNLRNFRESEFDDLLVKPIELSIVRRAVERWLHYTSTEG